MNRLDYLNARFKQIGYVPQYGSIALDNLVKSLKEKESVLYLLEGSVHNTLGFLIATNMKVLYVGVNKYKQTVIETLRYEDISSVQIIKTDIPSVELLINVLGDKNYEIKGCDTGDAHKFSKLINYFCEGNKKPMA